MLTSIDTAQLWHQIIILSSSDFEKIRITHSIRIRLRQCKSCEVQSKLADVGVDELDRGHAVIVSAVCARVAWVHETGAVGADRCAAGLQD